MLGLVQAILSLAQEQLLGQVQLRVQVLVLEQVQVRVLGQVQLRIQVRVLDQV